MFTKSSRYFRVATVTTEDAAGRSVQAVKRRPLPATAGEATQVKDGDQLDVISHRLYKDGTRFWHIGDAACELEVQELVRTAGRIIAVPRS